MRVRLIYPAIAMILGIGSAAYAGYRARANEPVVLAYNIRPGQSLRYRIRADISGSIPLFDSPQPVDIDALLDVVYLAAPQAVLADGSADVDFKVEAADLEILSVPFPISLEEARKVLNQRVTFSSAGEVRKVSGGEQAPFAISFPGVDPRRLYALVYPIVFQPVAVTPGDTWLFKSELIAGEGAKPRFSATLLASEPSDSPQIARIREEFQMSLDQKLDPDKKPVKDGRPAHWRRHGTVDGIGMLQFDRSSGIFSQSVIDISVNLSDDRLSPARTADEPNQIVSKMKAKVTVELDSGKRPQKAAARPDRA
jgi:hypothetical protein